MNDKDDLDVRPPELVAVPLPPPVEAPPARLPCVVCGLDLMVDLPDPKTGHTVESMHLHTTWQPFVCQRCWNAACDTARATMTPAFEGTEESDEETMRLALGQLDQSENLARAIVMMARNGYLGQSKRR